MLQRAPRGRARARSRRAPPQLLRLANSRSRDYARARGIRGPSSSSSASANAARGRAGALGGLRFADAFRPLQARRHRRVREVEPAHRGGASARRRDRARKISGGVKKTFYGYRT